MILCLLVFTRVATLKDTNDDGSNSGTEFFTARYYSISSIGFLYRRCKYFGTFQILVPPKNHSRQGSIQVHPNKLISKQFSVNTNIYRGETTRLTHILTINVYKIATII